jgi:phage terminase small subunit
LGSGERQDQRPTDATGETAEGGKKASRRELFVAEYLIDLNGRRAAIAVGYAERSAHVRASKLLKDPWVKKRIKEELKRREVQLTFTAERVLEELGRIAGVNIVDFYEPDGSLKELLKMPREFTAAVREVKITETVRTVREVEIKTRKTQLKLHSKVPALMLLGKRHKLFSDRVEVEGNLTLIVDM